MNNIDQILSDNYEQLDKLKAELVQIENLKNRIQELKESNEKLPEEYRNIFKLVADHATEYNKILGHSVKLFIEGNNELLIRNINNIDERTIQFKSINTEFKDEVNRLVEIDLESLFKELEQQFLEITKEKLSIELKKFDDKAITIQSKIDDFGSEITRLSKIDLEEHFDKHQSKLSEVFISVNGINSVISSISQNLNKIIQNLGEIEQTLVNNQKEVIKKFDTVSDDQAKLKEELTESIHSTQNELVKKLDESEIKINDIVSQNELLKKEIAVSKKISFATAALIVITLIILLVKQ
jgi:uncharacterized protein YukE